MKALDLENLILFIVGFLNLILGLLVFLKNKKDKINIYYGLTALTTAGWSLGLVIFRLVSDLNIAMLSAKFYYISAALIGASFLSFSFVFPFIKEKPKAVHNFLFYIFTGFVLFISIWPTIMIKEIVVRGWGKEAILTKFYYIYAIYFIICMIGAFGNFLQKYKQAD